MRRHQNGRVLVAMMAAGAMVTMLPKVVLAEAGRSLEEAESAYEEIDLAGALSGASAAVEGGGLRPAELARAYRLIGLTAAALEQPERSRDAFTRYLVFDPEAALDRSLAPSLRAPFMEARGYWSSRSRRLGVDVDYAQDQGALRLNLVDPLHLATTIVAFSRREGEQEYTEERVAAEERTYITVEGADEDGRVEYYLHLLDAHGNYVLELGDAEVPEVIGEVPVAAAGRPVARQAWFWVVIGTTIAVVGGGIALSVVLLNQSQTASVASGVSTIF